MTAVAVLADAGVMDMTPKRLDQLRETHRAGKLTGFHLKDLVTAVWSDLGATATLALQWLVNHAVADHGDDDDAKKKLGPPDLWRTGLVPQAHHRTSIAAQTGASRATVQRALYRAEEIGWLRVVEAPGYMNEYWISIGDLFEHVGDVIKRTKDADGKARSLRKPRTHRGQTDLEQKRRELQSARRAFHGRIDDAAEASKDPAGAEPSSTQQDVLPLDPQPAADPALQRSPPQTPRGILPVHLEQIARRLGCSSEFTPNVMASLAVIVERRGGMDSVLAELDAILAAARAGCSEYLLRYLRGEIDQKDGNPSIFELSDPWCVFQSNQWTRRLDAANKHHGGTCRCHVVDVPGRKKRGPPPRSLKRRAAQAAAGGRPAPHPAPPPLPDPPPVPEDLAAPWAEVVATLRARHGGDLDVLTWGVIVPFERDAEGAIVFWVASEPFYEQLVAIGDELATLLDAPIRAIVHSDDDGDEPGTGPPVA